MFESILSSNVEIWYTLDFYKINFSDLVKTPKILSISINYGLGWIKLPGHR